MNERPILVVGGTGKTGGRVTAQLGRRGVPVRPVSRSTQPRFDWDDKSTWKGAVEGTSGVYLMVAESDDGVERTAELSQLASASGVERIVLLSLRATAAGGGLFAAHEQAVRSAPLAWTILRPAWFCQNFSEGIFLDPVRHGDLRLPTGSGQEPFIDAEDVAAVAVAALTEDGHGGQIYEMSGPRPLSFDEATAEIAKATGREVRYTPVEADEYVNEMTGLGLPPEIAAFLVELFDVIRDGRSAYLNDGVQRVLDREPRDFADFVSDATAKGTWTP